MKRILITVLVSVTLSLLAVPASAQQKSELCVAQQKAKKETVKCPLQKKLKQEGIEACPDTGCGSVDKLLNQQKNTPEGDSDSFRDMTFAEVAAIPICVTGYKGMVRAVLSETKNAKRKS